MSRPRLRTTLDDLVALAIGVGVTGAALFFVWSFFYLLTHRH